MRAFSASIPALAGLLLATTAPAALAAGRTELVSLGRGGVLDDRGSESTPSVSGDGRYVAFLSYGTNLVPNDTNGQLDIFVRDRERRTTDRVSVGAGGEQADRESFDPWITPDGRYVAFDSSATNLVPGDTNGSSCDVGPCYDVFVRDLKLGTTERVSVPSGGGQATGGEFGSVGPSLSADGRYVAFLSDATNLVPGDTNGWRDVFVHDRRTGKTTLVSVATDGTQGDNNSFSRPAISADGNFVAFDSAATNLVPHDTNNVGDVFVRDLKLGTTERVSVPSGGGQATGSAFGSGAPSLSADGRYVAFESGATNLVPHDTNNVVDVFVRDRRAGKTTRVSVGRGGQGNRDSFAQSISADGRRVAFHSYATNLVPGEEGFENVFVRDRRRGVTVAASVRQSDGLPAGGNAPSISADGSTVAFVSGAALVPRDTNGIDDTYVRVLPGGE